MGIFDKIFGKKKKVQEQDFVKKSNSNLSPDTLFVENFKEKGGKFLYCTSKEEVVEYLHNIFEENNWEHVLCSDSNLDQYLNVVAIPKNENADAFFTTCEHLIAEDGSILFSSNQLQETKLAQYPLNFIVFAKTSQLTLNKDKALTSIKYHFKNEIPSNISAIKDYAPHKKDSNFLNYGNTNSKNLYLLLLEDL
ncbi:MAG TPA: hypothetical protein EYG92_01420 [Lutibacter sp.]|nr:hypothetical protein [Lutibacter sp.]